MIRGVRGRRTEKRRDADWKVPMSSALREPLPEPSLVRVLRERALEHPERPAYTFLADGEVEDARLTFGELDAKARALGAQLQQMGLTGSGPCCSIRPGWSSSPLSSAASTAGWWRCPPIRRARRACCRACARHRRRRPARRGADHGDLLGQVEALAGRLPELARSRWLATDAVDVPGLAEQWCDPEADADTLAFLQYTSGSTAAPKGVMVSHGNLLHNEEMIRQAFGQSESSVIVGWLPLYHDMGLIGNVLQPLYVGASCVLMSPVAFLQRPSRWLRAISRYRATTSGGPNFAYELCVRKVPAAERQGLDLSSWEVAFNGAEPVRPETLDRFAEAFAPAASGARPSSPATAWPRPRSSSPAGRPSEPPVVGAFRTADLEVGRVAPVAAFDPAGRRLVGCGGAWGGQRLAIVDPETGRRRPPEQVGEIWIAGASVAQGYWQRPEATDGDVPGPHDRGRG